MGAQLPGWEQVVDVVLRAAASEPFNRMAGWDILVDAEGVPVILEANGNSDVTCCRSMADCWPNHESGASMTPRRAETASE